MAYCPKCESTTHNCECEPDTTCDACNQGRAKGYLLSECAFCGAKDVVWCKNKLGGCDGCESCCKCNKEPEVCRLCDKPFTDEHPECELDPGYHRGNPVGHCCVESPNESHWICSNCYKHYAPHHNSNYCEECRGAADSCAENGHDWEVEGTIFEEDGFNNFHFHADLYCRECSAYGEACEDIGIQW